MTDPENGRDGHGDRPGTVAALWPLPGTGAGRRAQWVSIAVVAGLALSRLGLLADGPWEQDEAIFVSAIIDFDVPQHRPHPPAFPGWVAMGELAHLLVADRLRALQLLSSVCSVGTFVALAGLLRRLGLTGGVALGGALLYSFLPGVWAHAGRAFATTPSLFFLLVSIWCLQAAARSRPLAYAGWLSLAWAIAVRPQVLVLAPLCVLVSVRHRWWTTVGGWGPPALSGALLGAIVAWLAWDSGGLDPLIAATVAHAGIHLEAVDRQSLTQVTELGVVRGLGGLAAAATWAAASIAGARVAWRRLGPSVAMWLIGTATVTAAALFLVHDPYLPRYSPIAYLGTIPLIACAFTASAGRRAGVAIAGVACLAALTSAPAVLAISRRPLPVVAALRTVARAQPRLPVVFSPDLAPFVRMEHDLGNLRVNSYAAPPPTPGAAELMATIIRQDQRPFVWLDSERRVLAGLTIERRLFDDYPPAALDLSQRRYLLVELIEHAPVWLHGRYFADRTVWEETWAHVAPDASVWLEPGSKGLRLALTVPEEVRANQAVEVTRDGRMLLTRVLSGSRAELEVPVDDCQRGCVLDLRFASSFLDRSGGMAVAVRVDAAWLLGFPTAGYAVNPGRLREARALGVRLHGFHQPERFREDGMIGAWTNGTARVDLPGQDGRLLVTLADPTERVGQVTLRTDVETLGCQVGAEPTVCELRVTGGSGTVWVEINSTPFVPARMLAANSDARELGIVVHEVEFRPADGAAHPFVP